MTIHMGLSPGNVNWYIYGADVKQVKIGTTYYPYGANWQYIAGGTVTQITVGSNKDVFISFNDTSGPIVVKRLTLTGAIFGSTGQFDPLKIEVTSPATTTVSEVGLFNQDGLLYDHIFSPAITVNAGSNVTLPWKFNDTNTGVQTYTAGAVVNSGGNFSIATSNKLTLYYGSFTPGNLSLNYTNPLTVSFRFVKNDINSSATNLDIYYPSTFNSTCNLLYQNEQTNHTYHNLPISHAVFTFTGLGNDSVTVFCNDENSNETGTYVLTQASFPLLQQIKDFREGKFGTSGKFGAFDLVSLIALIVSIIGFNRVNESVGAIFNIFLIGFLAFFGIIAWPVILSSSVALALVLVVSSTRKTQFG